MSPEQAGTIAALARLRGEIAADRQAMARRTADLADAQRRLAREAGDTAALALEAWRHAYGAELDARKLAEHGARIAKVSERVEGALDALDAFLRHSGEVAQKAGETT